MHIWSFRAVGKFCLSPIHLIRTSKYSIVYDLTAVQGVFTRRLSSLRNWCLYFQNKNASQTDFFDWLSVGLDNRFCSCSLHLGNDKILLELSVTLLINTEWDLEMNELFMQGLEADDLFMTRGNNWSQRLALRRKSDCIVPQILWLADHRRTSQCTLLATRTGHLFSPASALETWLLHSGSLAWRTHLPQLPRPTSAVKWSSDLLTVISLT